MARSRRLSVFSLSFLDVMSCGFGAVVLIFLIINHEAQEDQEVVNQDLLSEIRMLDYQVQQGEKDLFELVELLDDVGARVDDSDENLNSTKTTLDEKVENLKELEELSLAERESLEALRSDVDTREEEIERLRSVQAANEGNRARQFEGEGDRQYLTGLKVGGKNIVIAVDASASMLDETIVNILRRRNMSDERKRQAPKWQRAVRTVEWLAAQLPLDAEFQVYAFNEAVTSLVPDEELDWVPMDDGEQLNQAVEALRQSVPTGGSSLENLMVALRDLAPIPDNVYLITDGLPTQGTSPPSNPMVTGRKRLELFGDAVDQLPRQVPINVIMFPIEGDPMASAAFWNLARVTNGAYISPSWDWP
jgi:hypothetical protein